MKFILIATVLALTTTATAAFAQGSAWEKKSLECELVAMVQVEGSHDPDRSFENVYVPFELSKVRTPITADGRARAEFRSTIDRFNYDVSLNWGSDLSMTLIDTKTSNYAHVMAALGSQKSQPSVTVPAPFVQTEYGSAAEMSVRCKIVATPEPKAEEYPRD